MKKKVAAGVAASVLAASIATNVLVEPADLIHTSEYLDSHTQEIEEGELGEYSIEYTQTEDLSVADAIRAWIISLPVAVKAVVLLPLWAIGAIPVAVFTGLGTVLAPIWSQVLAIILQVGVLVGVFCLVYKLLFPKKKVKELFKKKNFKWVILGAVGLVMLNFIMGTVWTGWPFVRVLLLVAGGFGILCLLWHRLFHKDKGPEPEVVTTKLQLEYE